MASVLSKLEKNYNGEFIVAKRKRGLGVLFIFTIIFGLGFLVSGLLCLLLDVLDFEVLIFAVIGLAASIMGICYCVKYFKMPKNAITYKDGTFRFPKKIVCKPSELGDISIKEAHNLLFFDFYSGTLYFSVNGEKRVLHFIADVQQVEADIVQIKREYTQSFYSAKINGQSRSAQKPPECEKAQSPKQIIPAEQSTQSVQPEQTESETEELVEKSEQLIEAEKIKLPDLPDLPDLN